MDKCVVCGGTKFHLVAGFYYCDECQTQLEAKKEQDVEFNTDSRTRMKKTLIKTTETDLDKGDEAILTSWEKYNYILIGLTNELIQLGANEKLKLTAAQLWATYLGKLEVAFTSTTRQAIPKLSRRYDKRDAEIIYGKIFEKTKKKKKARPGSVTSGSGASQSSCGRDIARRKKLFIDADYKSQVSNTDIESGVSQTSDSENSVKSTASTRGPRLQFNEIARKEMKKAAKLSEKQPKLMKKKFRAEYCTSTYIYGPDTLSPMKLWAILYLALRVNNEDIHLGDMFRFARDGYLSYYKLDYFIPPEFKITKKEAFILNNVRDLSLHGLTRAVDRLKKFLRVWKFPNPNLLTLIKQYCTELQLPNGVAQYAERILAAWPPNFNFHHKKYNVFPNYEARAMAIIIVTMKILFGLDGVTENEMSRVVERINEVAEERQILDAKLFSFREWQRYIECRRCTLMSEHLPTKLRYDPHSIGRSHLYANFFQSFRSRTERATIRDMESMKNNYASPAFFDSIAEKLKEMGNNLPEPKPSKVFTPSLTPQHSYLQQLLEDTTDPERNLPNILRQDFPSTKIGYVRNPESLKELAAQCDIDLNIVYNSAPYVRKVMQVFEVQVVVIARQRYSKAQNELTRVVAPTNMTISKKSDDPCEYLHRRHPGKILLETKKLRLHNKMMTLYQEQNKINEKKLYEQNNQTVQESSNEENNQTIQDPLSEESNQPIQDKSSEESSQLAQNKLCEENSEMVQDEVCEENGEAYQDNDYFGFKQVFPDGKLKISEFDSDSDSDSENLPKKVNQIENILLSNFEKQSMVNSIPNPWDVKKKFKSQGFGWSGDKPPPVVYGKRFWKKNKQANDADKNTTKEAQKNTESEVQSVEPGSTMSDVIVIVVNGDQNKENEAITENRNINEATTIVGSENKENEGIAENILINEDTIVVIDENQPEVTIENDDINAATIVIIDDNKETEVTVENKEIIEPTIVVIDENKEKDNKESETEMEVDFEAVEEKINIESKNIPSIEINEPEPVELSDNVDEITINDESDEEPEDSPADKEVIIDDDSSDDEVSILAESIDSRPSANQKDSLPEKELLTLFIPYKDYWLYRCSGLATLVSKHFRLLERDFPASFRWLLHECANIIEIVPEKLYREVCLVESYYTDILAPDEHMEKCEEYNTKFYRCQQNRTTVNKAWHGLT